MREEFVRLYSEVYKDMYRFALYTLKSEPDAEDAVSETIVDAYASFNKLRDKSSFKSWIFSILTVKCKRKMKDYYDTPISIDDDSGEILADEAAALEAGKAEEELVSNLDLRQALDTLDTREKTIVSMSYILGFEGKEIAGILKMNHNTVRTIERRALLKLRSLLS